MRSNNLLPLLAVALLALPGTKAGAQTGTPIPLHAWAPVPLEPSPYIPPNKPLKRLTDILARHVGHDDWSETEVLTRDFIGEYISMAPREKTKTLFWADDRVFWWVYSGQMKVTIQGQEPFIASKGFLVQVPYRVPYGIETVGSEPSVRFEVRAAGAVPNYVASETPAPVKGFKFIDATYTGSGKYDEANKPYLNFEKDIVQGGAKGGGFVKDDHTWANVIRAPGVPTPAPTSLGHFHENFAEFWVVMEGKLEFLIEGEPLITAGVGDIVFAPEERWHRALSAGQGMGTRLAITPRPPSLHYYQPGAAGRD
jgi:mannose-6-phosphate isomerase-like protein (cupin superfamily)